MTGTGLRGFAAACVIGLSCGLAAAQTAPPAKGAGPGDASQQIEALTHQLEALQQQMNELRDQLAALRGQQEAQKQQQQIEALREAARAQAATASVAPHEETQTFSSRTRMQPELNPEITVVGDMLAFARSEGRDGFSVGEWELDAQSYLDPYSFMHLTLSAAEGDGASVEEGYIKWLGLPGHLTLTVGRKRQQFGILNRWHPHALDQVELPLAIQRAFGEEGLIGTGVSVDWLMPRLWASTNELTVEVTNADNEAAFAGSDWQHPAFLARLKSYWDLTTDSYFELGLNALHGPADPDGHLGHDLFAADLTYSWAPTAQATYRGVILRGMLLDSRRELPDGSRQQAWGGYAYGQVRLGERWFTGVRYDRAEEGLGDGEAVWGLSPYLTWWQSEFVRLRAEANLRHYQLSGWDRELLLQITLAAGPHRHDSY